MVTNGIRISDFWYLSILKDRWLTHMTVSYNSINRTINKLVSWVGYDGVKTDIWMISAIKLWLNLHVNIVLGKHNLVWLKQTILFLFKIGIHHITVSFIRYDQFTVEKFKNNKLSYTDFIHYVKDNFDDDFISLLKNKLTFNDIPYCVLSQAHRKMVYSFSLSKTFNRFKLWNKSIFSDAFISERFFLKKCDLCKYKNVCCGIEKYYKIFFPGDMLEKEIKSFI